jgi:hypothetical protein
MIPEYFLSLDTIIENLKTIFPFKSKAQEYYIILIIKKLLRPPNTVSWGNLLITVFAAPNLDRIPNT